MSRNNELTIVEACHPQNELDQFRVTCITTCERTLKA